MKKLLITLCTSFALLSSYTAKAQFHRLTFSASIARAGYSMDQLRKQQDNFQAEIPFDAKMVKDYPAYYNVKGKVEFHISDKHTVGSYVESMSTGARLTYSDYSGSFYLDQLVSATHVGGLYHYRFYKQNNFTAHTGLFTGLIFTKHSVESRLRVYDDYDQKILHLRSLGVGAEPSISLRYHYKFLHLESSLSYLLNTNSSFHFKDYDDATYQDKEGNHIRANWSGLRAGISIGISLF